MHYLIYSSFLVLWGWILSGAYIRFVFPLIETIYGTLDAMDDGGPVPKGVALSVKIILTVAQTYVMGLWSAYCVLRTMFFLTEPGTNGWLYYISAFIICEGVLGIVAKREPYRGILSILHSTLAMGLFVMFALNPRFLASVYPWFPPMMKITLG